MRRAADSAIRPLDVHFEPHQLFAPHDTPSSDHPAHLRRVPRHARVGSPVARLGALHIRRTIPHVRRVLVDHPRRLPPVRRRVGLAAAARCYRCGVRASLARRAQARDPDTRLQQSAGAARANRIAPLHRRRHHNGNGHGVLHDGPSTRRHRCLLRHQPGLPARPLRPPDGSRRTRRHRVPRLRHRHARLARQRPR